jgi:preprotein translocase subunit YajC
VRFAHGTSRSIPAEWGVSETGAFSGSDQGRCFSPPESHSDESFKTGRLHPKNEAYGPCRDVFLTDIFIGATNTHRFSERTLPLMRIPFLRFLIGLTPVMLMALPVLAADPAKPVSPMSSLGGMLPMLLFMFVVIYFMMIRPEQKKQKARLAMISAMKKGDRVMMAGGMYGTVHNVKEKTVMVKIAENTVVEFEKSSVTMIPGSETASSDKTEAAEKDKK